MIIVQQLIKTMNDDVRRRSNGNDDELQYLFACRVYALFMAFVGISLIQWLIILNLGSEFDVYDSMISMSAFTIALIIVTLYVIFDCVGTILPVYLQWLFALILLECFTFAVGTVINKCSNFVFYTSLIASLAVFTISNIIGMQCLNVSSVVFALILVIWCTVCFTALVTSLLIDIFYSMAVSSIVFAVISYVTVTLMIICDSMMFNTFLLGTPRIKKCIKPALNFYTEYTFLFFVTLIVWLRLI